MGNKQHTQSKCDLVKDRTNGVDSHVFTPIPQQAEEVNSCCVVKANLGNLNNAPSIF